MQWGVGIVAAAIGGSVTLVLLWRLRFFTTPDDDSGFLAWNAAPLALVGLAAVVGLVGGGLHGLLPGLAIVVAAGNVLFGMVLAWGLAGGDDEQANPVVGLLALGVFFGCLVTAMIAFFNGDQLVLRHYALMLAPPVLTIMALPFTRGGWRLAEAATGVALLAVPAALLWTSAVAG